MTLSPLNFDEFQAVSKSDWLAGANSQLKVENALEKLSWNLTDDFRLPPYFDQDTTRDLSYLTDFFSRTRFDWQLFKFINSSNTKEANKAALRALNEGCSGVVFDMGSEVDLITLTKDVMFEHCFVSFLFGDSRVEQFRKDHEIRGFHFSKEGGLKLSTSQSLEDIGDILKCYAENPTSNTILVEISNNFFFEIARLRTLRYLIDRINQVLDVKSGELWIHASIPAESDEDKNLLVQTSSGLAAVIGGANSVSFHSNGYRDRIACNVGNLIREEAKITEFMDASSGSYFVDSLTDQMIQKVWSDFQSKMS